MRTIRNTDVRVRECESERVRARLDHVRHFSLAPAHSLTLTLTFAIALLTSCGSADANTETTDSTATPVTVMQVRHSHTAATVSVPGLFTTDDETALSFLSGGIVRSVLVREGEPVKAGQLLATLEPTNIDAQVQQAQLGFEKAERDLQRAEALYKDSVISLETMQNARTGLGVAKEQLTAAQYGRRHTEIRASGSGFVLRKFVNEGQLVGAGSPVLMVNGAGKGAWLLKAGLSDKDWAQVHVGDSATVQADAFPSTPMKAVVSSKSMGADQRSGAFLVELRIVDPQPQLASGLYGKATIHTRGSSGAIAIPYEALLDGDENKGFVFVAGADGRAQKRAVTVQGITNTHVLVSGLDTSERLIVKGGPYLTEGSAVSVR